jgi:hypothetical protein
MGLLAPSAIFWRCHVHPVYAPGSQISACIAGYVQKGVVGVHNLLPFDDNDPDNTGVYQDIHAFLVLVLNISTGAKLFDDLACFITHGYAAD